MSIMYKYQICKYTYKIWQFFIEFFEILNLVWPSERPDIHNCDIFLHLYKYFSFHSIFIPLMEAMSQLRG